MSYQEPLTKREREVLALVAQGLMNGQIADFLVISEKTVRRHLNTIYAKLDVTSRLQAALKAQVLVYVGYPAAANASESVGNDTIQPDRESSG